MVVTIASTPVAHAERLDEATYTERAVAADPRPRAAAVDEASARADEVEARVWTNPALSADREDVPDDPGGAEHVIALELALDVSGRRGQRARAARSRAAAARTLRGATEVTVELDARAAYREAAFRRARAALFAQGRADLVRAVEVVRARVRAGDAAEHEVVRAELELVEYDDELAQAELGRDAAERSLGARLGTGAIETTGEISLPSQPSSVEALVERSMTQPERVALDHLDAAASSEAAAASRAWIPDLRLRGGAKSLGDGGATRWGYVVGLGIELPLFDRGQAERARADVARRRVDAARGGLAERARARIAAARDDLARRCDLAARSTADRAARVDTLISAAEAAYREGGPLVDLLDAYRLRRRARLRALELRHDARLAELELWRAVGRLP